MKSDCERGVHGNRTGIPVSAASVASAIDTIGHSVFIAFTATTTFNGSEQWLLDSGCSTHVTGVREYFSSYTPFQPGPRRIRVVNGMESDALGEGEVILTVRDQRGRRETSIVIAGVLHVPDCGRVNLLSVSQLCNSSYSVDFNKNGGALLKKDNQLIVKLEGVNGLYVLQVRPRQENGKALVVQEDGENAEQAGAKRAALWHFRLAHLGTEAVRKLSREDNEIPKLAVVPRCVCLGCIYGKMSRKPFPSLLLDSRATQPLEIVHTDITGPVTSQSLGGAIYLLMFTDGYTRFKIGYLIKRKSEALKCFQEYKALAEKHHEKPIRKLRTDGGGEYTSNEFSHLLKKKGIEAQRTTPYTPQSNGMSERANRTIVGTTRALLHAVSAPKQYWGEAAMTAIYVRNRLPTKVLAHGQTPHEKWYGRRPLYGHLRVWGCLA